MNYPEGWDIRSIGDGGSSVVSPGGSGFIEGHGGKDLNIPPSGVLDEQGI